jgi:hypothetical protein
VDTLSKLSSKKFGTYIEYLAKLQFLKYGFDIYHPEIDDKGIDFIVRISAGVYLEIQTKGRRSHDYFYMEKPKFPINESTYLFLALCPEKISEDTFYLIPSTAWRTPNDLFRDRDYVKKGQKSKPEWGLTFTKKSLPLLDYYRFSERIQSLTSHYRQ